VTSNQAAVCRYDLAHDGETQTGPVWLGRTEKLKYVDSLGNPAAGIGYLENQAIKRLPPSQGKLPSFRHRFDGVPTEIQQGLF
jgi:hypothetical protein